MRIKIAFSIIATCLFLALIFINVKAKEILFIPMTPKNGYVPDDKTAIKIAEAIWLPIFGNEIYNYKPYKAELIGGKIWKVYGTVHTDKGGSPFAEIQKSDCKIIKVYHEK